MMLFLGAGASKSFGLKTMKEMSEEFEEEIETEDEKELYSDIKNTLMSDNLEDILTILNNLAKVFPITYHVIGFGTVGAVSVKYELENPAIRYLMSNLDWCFEDINTLIPQYVELLEDKIKKVERISFGRFRGVIQGKERMKKLNELKLQKALKQKSLLFNYNLSRRLKLKIIRFIKENCVILGEEEQSDVTETYGKLSNTVRKSIPLLSSFSIFTTNYDVVINRYIENSGFSYYDGFENGIWNPSGYDKNVTFKLYKLHGSIDYYIEGDKIVKRDILYPTPTTSGEERLESMIYPMREKEVYKDPFFELFTRLKTSLLSEKICIVIGYSFGDEHIKNIFFDAVKRNPEIRIFMINPNAKKIRDDLTPIKYNIEPIEGKFGEEEVFEELKQKLSEV